MPLGELVPVVLKIARSRCRDGKFQASELLQKTEVITGIGLSHDAKPYGGTRLGEVAAVVDKALQSLIASGEIVPAYTAGAGGLFHIKP